MIYKIAIFIPVFFMSCFPAACSGGGEIKAIHKRGELRVGVKSDVPRFGFLNLDNDELEGMEIDIARMIAKDILGDENAVKFIIVGGAQTRAAMLKNGEIDIAIATFTITEERRKEFNFSRPYFTDELGSLVRADSKINELKDLDGRIAGVVRGSTAKTAFENECLKLEIDVTVLEFANYPEIKEALITGKIDAFVSDKSILYGYSDEESVLLNDRFNPQRYGIAGKIENRKLARRVETVLDTMEKNGDLTAIFEKWGLHP